MSEAEFQKTIAEIIDTMEQAGYDPYAQLTGYLKTGADNFITRKGDARAKIVQLDKEQLRQFVARHG